MIQSLHGGPHASANDKLCKLLFFIATLRTNGAAQVTALIPYLAYSRKDRQTKPRDPVTSQYMAQLIEAAGADCVATLDVHNIVAFQNAFRIRTVHLDTRRLFCDPLISDIGEQAVCVVSPDPGGVKRAQLFREMLERRLCRPVGQAFMDKRRSAEVVSGDLLIGDVKDSLAIVIDDLISTGGTMARAAGTLMECGAAKVICCVAHGLFTGKAEEILGQAPISAICITDTVPPFRLSGEFIASNVEVVSAGAIFADCISSLEGGKSISKVLGDE